MSLTPGNNVDTTLTENSTMSLQTLIQGISNYLTSPAINPDGTLTSAQGSRMGKYNELYTLNMFPTKHMAALAGNYYSINNAAAAVVTSLVALTEASPALIIENTASPGGVNIMLDYVRIDATAIAAAAVDWQYAWKLDNIRNKWASAGSTVTPQNGSMGSTSGSAASVHFGALVVATAQQSSTNARTIGSEFITPTGTAPVQIIGDMVDFRFGNLEAPLPTVRSNVASNGAHTFAACRSIGLGPVILTPGTTATLFLWGTTGGSAASYTLQGGWYEY